MEIKIANKFKISRKIASGPFWNVYLGVSQNGEEVCIILEEMRKESKIQTESRIYRTLQEGTGIPKLHWVGQESDFNIMVLELVGPSLETLLKYCKGIFSMKTVLMLADQLLSRIEFMHSYYFIHRDIKPQNFVVGIGKKANTIYLVDFSLSKKYIEKYNQHIQYREGKRFVGTARYASLHTHFGIEQSRRDDLESLGYVLVYFLTGRLPWQGLPGKNKEEKYENILNSKYNTRLEDLCQGIPSEFNVFLNYCRNLRFDEKPDYNYLRRICKDLFLREGYAYDNSFDWYLPRSKRNVVVEDL
ncbi:hypothetical protein SteCoe_28424 [Stentor coeruleus]|uniref:Casein kinase I n=1 Tax=Stentor coeruleus TaxID=5963 RepID=A0A1R2B874_9CILI|nr:hypothetical protein SteCoe_28424 [Stentor coeruleus]